MWATVLKRLSTLKENLEPFLASEVATVEGLDIIFLEPTDKKLMGSQPIASKMSNAVTY